MRQLRKPPNAPAGRNPLPAASQDMTEPNQRHSFKRYAAGLALLMLLVTGVSVASWQPQSDSGRAQTQTAPSAAHAVPWLSGSVAKQPAERTEAQVRARRQATFTAIVAYTSAVHDLQVRGALAAIQLTRQRAAAQHQHNNRQRSSGSSTTVAVSSGPTSGPSPWDGIAKCETGSNWSMQGPRYSGGLGFYNGTWDSFGGRQFAPNAGLATRDQQITVAERVYARYGLSGWGCKAYYGK